MDFLRLNLKQNILIVDLSVNHKIAANKKQSIASFRSSSGVVRLSLKYVSEALSDVD